MAGTKKVRDSLKKNSGGSEEGQVLQEQINCLKLEVARLKGELHIEAGSDLQGEAAAVANLVNERYQADKKPGDMKPKEVQALLLDSCTLSRQLCNIEKFVIGLEARITVLEP